jgi:hypothetical protein
MNSLRPSNSQQLYGNRLDLEFGASVERAHAAG